MVARIHPGPGSRDTSPLVRLRFPPSRPGSPDANPSRDPGSPHAAESAVSPDAGWRRAARGRGGERARERGRWRESCGYLPPSRRDRCYIPPPPSPSSARPALLSPSVTGAEFLPSSPYFFFFVQIRGGFVLCRFGASFFVLFRDLGFLIPF